MLGRLNNSFFNRVNWSKFLRYLSLFFLILGILVRIIQYLSNRSLWFDEANLALNIVHRSYGELVQTLDHNQAAPLGFLWLEKLAIQVFGNNEYALRLLPTVAGIVALVIFYFLANRYCSKFATPIAIALFACSRYTLYFATELKPYSSDVAIALLLFWILTRIRHQILKIRAIFGLALLGALSIWLSYPVIFILGGLEAYYLLTASKKYLRRILANRIVIYLVWVGSFASLYFLTIANTLNNEELSSSWESRYPNSFGDIIWLLDALGRFFYHPMGFLGITDGIGIVAFIFGCIAWYRHNRTIFGALVAPFVATIIAAYLQQYPFRDRLVLFLAPLGMLIVAEGIRFLLLKLGEFHWSRNSEKINRPKLTFLMGLLGIICLWGLLVPAIARASNFVIHPELKHEVKPVLEYVVSQEQPGDKIYVYSRGYTAFLYYTEQKDYSGLDYIRGTINFSDKVSNKTRSLSDKWQEFAMELKPLIGESRVWFILREDQSFEAEVLQYLNQVGQQLDSFQKTGASAYLYELATKLRPI
ncbi:glycosyltransferase family 39 protein [Pleurocapsa sp. PCC 7319]|uniref:glycosyltransferase family 39 protein n=1 Tax=Pleurocapsa sp. PCC 7319 TaxID=118161 RepID=UPI00034C5585|nr:glycosyltransferase family 39 protein [Pleurocapsa sp. PCC 7319]